MKLMVHWNKKHQEQEKEISSKLQQKHLQKRDPDKQR